MRISDWSSDVCSSDLHRRRPDDIDAEQLRARGGAAEGREEEMAVHRCPPPSNFERDHARHDEGADAHPDHAADRSEEHTSELQSLMRISYAVFCLKKRSQRHRKSTTSLTRIYHTLIISPTHHKTTPS